MMKYELSEEDRQLILLSLAFCSLLRPGFLYMTEELAKKLNGEEMFLDFRRYNEDIVKPPPLFVEGT